MLLSNFTNDLDRKSGYYHFPLKIFLYKSDVFSS